MTVVLVPDGLYVVRQWARGIPELQAEVGARVDLHEPRSPDAKRIVLDLVDDGEVSDDPFMASETLVQVGCWGPTKKDAARVARTFAGAVRTLRGARVELGADATVHGYEAGLSAFALFARWQSTIEHPQSARDNAGFIVTAAFRLSPL